MKGYLKRLLSIFPYVVFDAILLNLSVAVSVFLRFDMDFGNPHISYYFNNYSKVFLIYTAVSIVCYYLCRIYSNMWFYTNPREIFQGIMASVLSSACLYVSCVIMGVGMPRTIYPFAVILNFIFLFASRYSVMEIHKIRKLMKLACDRKVSRLMIIGAGEAGAVLIKECNSRHTNKKEKPVCIIDDDENKIGKYINGVKVVGSRDSIIKAVKDYNVDEIIFAIPSAPQSEKSAILSICKETGCSLKILPGYYQFINGDVRLAQTRKVKIEDLLGRSAIKMDEKTLDYVKNKTVIVTGGGGSIGSELCRQIAKHGPKTLIIFDIYENNAYSIQNEIKRRYPELNLITLIGSVRDSKRINEVFTRYKPDIVYHAAAHKHVPLMEDSPNEAIKNNVFGTLKTARAAHENGVKRFVLISTDKAVNPTNVMGASKRLCEMVVQYYNSISKTDYVAVRFGNVLGSNGSVIPLFEKQIEEGGPITVTDPNIIRYFMTIPEAVSLVIEAGAMAKGGEIFILDMGKPVRIFDLAENMIKLSGLTPYVDIDIVFTGLRPGEKLYEELLMNEEGITKTSNNLIYIGKPLEFDYDEFIKDLHNLFDNMYDEKFDIRAAVKNMVPTYDPDRDNRESREAAKAH